jgi:hypothetical protein
MIVRLHDFGFYPIFTRPGKRTMPAIAGACDPGS